MKATIQHHPFTLGVNYWPRHKAMYWWQNFDPAEVREEFQIIRSLGMKTVRIFLLWEDWQPTPTSVDQQALKNLESVCDIAADLGLTLNITFFTGLMSGPSWAPEWLLRRDQKPQTTRPLISGGQVVKCDFANMYVDPTAIQASQTLIQTVVGTLKDHPGVGVWNLGNEPDLFVRPPTAKDGIEWAKRMAGCIHNIDSQHPVTWGLHAGSLFEDNGLRVHEIFAELDFAVMHGYSIFTPWIDHPLDPNFVPFICALTQALSSKPVLMEEFGGCTLPPGETSTYWEWEKYGGNMWRQFMASEEDMADHIEGILQGLVDVGATGAMLWCFADYAPELYDRPPCDLALNERSFGFVRPDGSFKPQTDVIKRFIESEPTIQNQPRRRVELDISPAEYYENPALHGQRLYRDFLASAQVDTVRWNFPSNIRPR